MQNSTQRESIPDHELVERVFDVVDDLRDGVVEKSGQASGALRKLRDRAQANERLGIDCGVEPEGFVYTCPGCDGDTRSVTLAFQRDEPCPICGLLPDVATAVEEARSRAVGPCGRGSLERRYPLVAFLVARSVEADDRDDPAGRALAHLTDRVIGWPRRDDRRMWQRDEDLLRIAAAAYADHPDFDPAWTAK